MFILWCHFSKLYILMERCKYQSLRLLNPIHSSRWVGGVEGGTVEHWFAVLKVLWSRDRCSWKVTECIARYPYACPVPFLFAEAMSLFPSGRRRRASRSCSWAQGKLFNEQGVLFPFLSSSLSNVWDFEDGNVILRAIFKFSGIDLKCWEWIQSSLH